MLNLQFNIPIPNHYGVPAEFSSASSKMDKVKWISEFQLETLCREIILHGMEFGRSPKMLREWNTLARVINKLKDLEDFIAERFRSAGLIMQELHRTVHRQFPWQMSRPTAGNITRYLLIYNSPSLHGIIQRTTGLTVHELFLMGQGLLGMFLSSFAMFYPPTIEIPGLTNAILDKFLHHFAIPLSTLKQKLRVEREMNDRFSYAYSSLRAWPLIRATYQGRDSVVCPMPTLLFWRFTSGVYYEICHDEEFGNAFGAAFQLYVGQVLQRGTSVENMAIYPETEYHVGRDLKRTVDWIAAQDNAAL
jgi:hypothetical protein